MLYSIRCKRNKTAPERQGEVIEGEQAALAEASSIVVRCQEIVHLIAILLLSTSGRALARGGGVYFFLLALNTL
jgi:hypothetical protein